jgi:predicted GTPase
MTPNPSSDPPILAPAASPAAPASAPPELPVAPKLPSFLEAAGEPVETPSDPFPVLRTALASFRAELSEACPEIGRMLSEPLDRVTKPEVTLTFSGPFNAGKSTLLNAALRRPLLPMDELPETGTICRLRPGRDDAGLLRTRDGIQPIPCTTEVIRHYCSVLASDGERRGPEATEQELEMVLQGSPIPPQVCWADSPGINDTRTMDERAFLAASEADLVVWVINSRSPFSEAEDQFLQRVAGLLGPTSLLFVLNAFLADRTPEAWREFSERIEPALRTRLADHREAMGVPRDVAPPMISVCAKAALRAEEAGFGAAGLLPFITSLQGRDLPRVRISRLQRVAGALDLVAEKIRERLERVRSETAAAETAESEAVSKDTQELRRIKVVVEGAVASLYSALAERVKGSAASGAASIKKPIRRDDTYRLRLIGDVKIGAETAVDTLVANLNTEAMASGRRVIPDSLTEAMKRLLDTDDVPLVVARHPPKRKSLNKGMVVAASYGFIYMILFGLSGCLIGAYFGYNLSGGFGGFVGFVMGGIAGAIAGWTVAIRKGERVNRDEAETLDVAETRSRVGGSAAQVLLEMNSRRTKVIELIMRHFSRPGELEATRAGRLLETRLQAHGKTAEYLANSTREIARHIVP